MKTYICCDERRRDAVRAQHTLKGVDYNGIDYLEVVNEHMLQIYFIHKLKDGVLEKENVRITGGERICDVSVVSTKLHSKTLTVTLNKPGDYSIYTLSLTADPAQLQLDQLLSSIDFTFDLPTNEIDCAAEEVCVPEVQLAPDIDYLAKDFTSFRQLMLDRLTTLVPQWQERSTADMGVMLVETLAYVADHLSYRQDVIATESYLSTARRRVSARRHARLLDYFTNDGCNARVWVQIQVNKDVKIDSTSSGKPILLLTQIAGQTRVVFPRNSPIFTQAMNTMSTQPTVFEPMENPIWLFFNHNQISFYTWGERECCLPKGCTRATLKGKLPDLQPGDVLIFKEMVNAHTGAEEDAEPAHRHAVRLTKVLFDEDPLGTWPNDQSGAQDGASDLGKTIAEFEIVEDDHLRIEDARMTGMEAGYHVKKQDEWTEEETDTIIHRYLIEQPDKSTLNVEARMRKGDRHVELHLVEASYVVQATYRKETYEEGVDRGKETHRQETTETEQEIEQAWDEQMLEAMGAMETTESVEQRDEVRETGDMEEDIMKQPTAKLAKITPLEEAMTLEEITDIDTQEFHTLLQSEGEADSETESEEVQEEEFTEEESEPREEATREEKRERTRIVHTYRIVREPDYHQDITEIEWGYEDALPFPLCISATTDYKHGHRYIEDVSVALGNIVLADHGYSRSFSEEEQNKDYLLIPHIVPQSIMNWAASQDGRPCEEPRVTQVPPRFYPQLKYSPVTFAAPYDKSDSTLSATAIMQFDASTAVAAISLKSDLLAQDSRDGKVIPQITLNWHPQRDLLGSRATDPHFVVEVENDGSAFLRFGDDRYGMRPDPYTRFLATYRIGNGVAGNVGYDALYHLVSDDTQLQEAVIAVNNPLPAQGGVDQESIEDIRQNLAGSFTLPERGVTPQDYKEIVERDFKHLVQRANTNLLWTGSWYTMFLAVERVGGMPVDDVFKRRLREQLEKYRMAGTDLVIVAPVYVPLEIALTFTVSSGYLPDNVKTELLKVFSNRQWPDGERGVFYADANNYTFGSPVYLNSLYAAANREPGVASVKITTFQRQGIAGTGLVDGVLPMNWQEIPILENDPYYPERGLFSITVEMPGVEALYV